MRSRSADRQGRVVGSSGAGTSRAGACCVWNLQFAFFFVLAVSVITDYWYPGAYDMYDV